MNKDMRCRRRNVLITLSSHFIQTTHDIRYRSQNVHILPVKPRILILYIFSQ